MREILCNLSRLLHLIVKTLSFPQYSLSFIDFTAKWIIYVDFLKEYGLFASQYDCLLGLVNIVQLCSHLHAKILYFLLSLGHDWLFKMNTSSPYFLRLSKHTLRKLNIHLAKWVASAHLVNHHLVLEQEHRFGVLLTHRFCFVTTLQMLSITEEVMGLKDKD